MLTLSKKLLLNKIIAIGVDDYNSFHKMCRVNDFREIFPQIEDLIFDLVKYNTYHSPKQAEDLNELINIKKKILIIDDSSSVAYEYWNLSAPDYEMCDRDKIPNDLSEYWLIIEIMFKKTTSVFSNLKTDALCLSLVSQNNEAELNNPVFKKSYKRSYSTEKACHRLTGIKSSVFGREILYLEYGPWPKPKKDWQTLEEIPVPEEIQKMFKK